MKVNLHRHQQPSQTHFVEVLLRIVDDYKFKILGRRKISEFPISHHFMPNFPIKWLYIVCQKSKFFEDKLCNMLDKNIFNTQNIIGKII